MADITFEIKESLGVLSESSRGWTKKRNLDFSRLYLEDYLQRSDIALYCKRNEMLFKYMLVTLEAANATDHVSTMTGFELR